MPHAARTRDSKRRAARKALPAAPAPSLPSPKRAAEATREPGKRAAILDAATALFAERGFHGTAVPLVAERAGVGAGTLYRYFESKEALVNELFRMWKGRLAAGLLAGLDSEAPPRQQFHEYWHRMGQFARQHPEGYAFLELHHHAPYLDEESRAIEQRLLLVARSMVERAQAQQAMKPVAPELLMAVVYGAFVGIVKGVRMGHLSLTRELLEQAERVVWEAIRA